MINITSKNIKSLKMICSDYGLNDYAVADLSIGNDDNIYILFASKNSGERAKEYKAVVLQVVWDTGDFINSYMIDFGTFEANIHFIQPINEKFLLLSSRARYYADKTFDKNALIVDETGHIKSRMCLGDGIEQCMVDGQNRIITSYYDEGVIGSYGWTDPIGSSGIIVWSENGDKLWENNQHDILDCYAMNLGLSDELWFYYYTDFNLVKTDYNYQIAYSPQISYASRFLLNQKCTSILFLNGVINSDYDITSIYSHKRHYKLDFKTNRLTNLQECKLIGLDNKEIEIIFYGFRKNKAVFLDKCNDIYVMNFL